MTQDHPPEGRECLTQIERDREGMFKIIDEMREAVKDVPSEEVEREAARTIAEVRAEMRAERGRSAARP